MPIRDDVILEKSVMIWHPDLCNLYGCTIGAGTGIGAFCEIQRGVEIGYGCKLQAFIFIPEGVKIGNKVFIGPHVCFTNDKYPSALNGFTLLHTKVEDGASIGANSTICPGITIGSGALIGAGSVVTKDVPPNELWVGNPARFVRSLK
jgi:serine acetyltransferase